jgi:peptidoglycan/xylan/chitin deacetylase (PgdA/CDA1 family)
MTMTDFTWPGGKRAALSLTFDDARLSQPDQCLPILDRYGVKATFYVSLGNVKQRSDDWRAIAARGHEIGNHTVSHPCSGNFGFSRHNALEDYTLERIEGELTRANEEIRETLGVTPVTFAYPCGQSYVGRGEELRSYVPLVARHFLAGRAFHGESANCPARCDLAQLLSTSADQMPWETLQTWLDSTLKQGEWLILTAHEVGEQPWHQVMTTDTLERACRFAADPANGIWVDTVENISRYVKDRRA